MTVRLSLTERHRSAHAALSEHQLTFLDFVERNPRCLSRSTFGPLIDAEARGGIWMRNLQSWPTLIDPEPVQRAARASANIHRLIEDIPRRFFDFNPRKLSEFYGLPQKAMETALWTVGARNEQLFARGDFIRDREDFKCLEYNFESSLGGWHSSLLESLYLSLPMIARFLDEHRLRIHCVDSVRVAFSIILDEALGREDLNEGDELNLAIASPAFGGPLIEILKRLVERRYREILEEKAPGMKGQVFFCVPQAFDLSQDTLLVDQNPIQIAILLGQAWNQLEQGQDLLERGRLNLYNRPIHAVLRSKLNLALLSSSSASDVFTPEEARTIEDHIPWSRRVRDTRVRYRGEDVALLDLLARNRRDFVLKDAISHGGESVLIGRFLDGETWNQAVRKALEEGTWISQEYVESEPYLYQTGERDYAEHDLVFGCFSFGGEYGGTILRMTPKSSGILSNVSQGASQSPLFEVHPVS